MMLIFSFDRSQGGGPRAWHLDDGDRLLEDVSGETLEDLTPLEAEARLTLWAIEWRRIADAFPGDKPGRLLRTLKAILGEVGRAVSRYPGTLPAIPALDRGTTIDLARERDRARDLLAGEALRRTAGGWKEDLALAARLLGIDPDAREEQKPGQEGQAA